MVWPDIRAVEKVRLEVLGEPPKDYCGCRRRASGQALLINFHQPCSFKTQIESVDYPIGVHRSAPALGVPSGPDFCPTTNSPNGAPRCGRPLPAVPPHARG